MVEKRSNTGASGDTADVPSPLRAFALLAVVLAGLVVLVAPYLVRTHFRLAPSAADCKADVPIAALRKTPTWPGIDLTGRAREPEPSPSGPAVWFILRDFLQDPLRTDITVTDLVGGIFQPFTFPRKIFPEQNGGLLFFAAFLWGVVFYGLLISLPFTICWLLYSSFRIQRSRDLPPWETRVRALWWLAPPTLLTVMNGSGLLPVPAFCSAYFATMCLASVLALALYADDKVSALINEHLRDLHAQAAARQDRRGSWLDDESVDRDDTLASDWRDRYWNDEGLLEDEPPQVSRIPEKLLNEVAVYGGWPGALTAIGLFHHKASARKADFRNRLGGAMIMHAVLVVVMWSGLLYLAVGQYEGTLTEQALRAHKGAVRENLMDGWYDAHKTAPPLLCDFPRSELAYPLGTLTLYGTKPDITTVLVAGVTTDSADQRQIVQHWVLAPAHSPDSRRQVLKGIERALPTVRAEVQQFFNGHGVSMVLFDFDNHLISELPQPQDPATYPTEPIPRYRRVNGPVFVLKRVTKN